MFSNEHIDQNVSTRHDCGIASPSPSRNENKVLLGLAAEGCRDDVCGRCKGGRVIQGCPGDRAAACRHGASRQAGVWLSALGNVCLGSFQPFFLAEDVID